MPRVGNMPLMNGAEHEAEAMLDRFRAEAAKLKRQLTKGKKGKRKP